MSLRTSMFLHLLRRGLAGRGSKPVIALVALTVASTMIAAMLSLYDGLEDKLNREFRSYGANITLAAPDGESLPENSLERAEALLPPDSLVVPFAFAVAHSSSEEAVIVAGMEMQQVRRLNRWWLVSRWPEEDLEALVGEKAARHLGIDHGDFQLDFAGNVLRLKAAGTLKTGSDEEGRIYIPLSTFERWTGIRPSLLEILVAASPADVNAAISRLQSAFPGMRVQPVRQLLETEGAVITRMRSVVLASTLLIIITLALCVFSTLTSSVLERRRDFAIMKAIGASQRTVNLLFTVEALSIALLGGLMGYICGSGLAALIAEVNFHAVILPRIGLLPLVLAASMLLALLTALFPLAQLQQIEPASILKGE